MTSLENPNQEARFFAFYTGVVVERADPKKIARVRVRIPGLIDDRSAWALPIGTFGGGYKARRGLKFVPKMGAEVAVFFHLGDIDHPYYIAGNWGLPKDDTTGEEKTEVPGGGRGFPPQDDGNGGPPPLWAEGDPLSPEEAPDVDAFETDSFLILVDERVTDSNPTGNGSLLIRSKKSGDRIEYDGQANAWIVRATQAISLESDGFVSINANQVSINGRTVRNTSNPI